jgi:hypothetical protein
MFFYVMTVNTLCIKSSRFDGATFQFENKDRGKQPNCEFGYFLLLFYIGCSLLALPVLVLLVHILKGVHNT